MKKPIVGALIILGLLGLGLFMFRRGSETKNGLPSDQVPVSTQKTITGVFVCLPHKDSTGPQTMECAFGMKGDDGQNYALDWGDSATSAFDLPMAKKFSVTGLYTPIAAVSTDHWKIYNVAGIIKVSNYVELTSDIPNPPVNGKITFELNKPLAVVGSTTIRITAVTQDSRCPSDVTCIQAGKVTVSLNVTSPTGSLNMELEPGKTATTDTLEITLEDVLPHPISTHKTKDTEYRFIVTVKTR